MKNKKAILTETIIFVILTVVFTALLLVFIARLGDGTTFYEQSNAKLICLAIDSVKPGMNITMYVPEMYKLADKNKISEKDIISITSDNKIVVKLSKGKGYEFRCFSPIKQGMIELNWKESTIKIIA